MHRRTGRWSRTGTAGWAGAVVVVVAAVSATIGGCGTGSPELRRVTDQSVRTSAALGDSAERLGSAADGLLAAHSASVRAAARERVAQGLARLAGTDDRDAVIALVTREAGALRQRLDLVAIDQRGAAARELAGAHGELIDIAAGTPGFTPERVADDALSLDALNLRIEGESSAVVRDGLLARRAAVLDAYMPCRAAAARAAVASEALARVLAEVQAQRRVAGVHAEAMASVERDGRDADMARSEILDVVRALSGAASPDTRERVRRIDSALEAAARLGTR